jgi:hypothetical protein
MSLLQVLIASHLTVRRSLSGFEHISSQLVHPPNMAMCNFSRIIQDYRERKIAPRTPQTIRGGFAGMMALSFLFFPLPISFEIAFYDLITTKNSELDKLRTDYWKAGKIYSDVVLPTEASAAQYRMLCQRAYSVWQWYFITDMVLTFTDLLHCVL